MAGLLFLAAVDLPEALVQGQDDPHHHRAAQKGVAQQEGQGGQTVYGNPSDDGVEDFSYDYIYHNDKPLEEARADFLDFFARILEEAP